MKYILNYIKVINQLLVFRLLKYEKISRIRELNSCLWSSKVIRASQSLLSTEPLAPTAGFVFKPHLYHVVTTPASHVYHTRLSAVKKTTCPMCTNHSKW